MAILVALQLLKIAMFSIWSLKLEMPDGKEEPEHDGSPQSNFGSIMGSPGPVKLPKPKVPGSIYNYLQQTDRDDDDEEMTGLMQEPWTGKEK